MQSSITSPGMTFDVRVVRANLTQVLEEIEREAEA
jgi:hypothetical protein